MCGSGVIQFGRAELSHAEIAHKRVLEVGAYNVNGSLRSVVDRWEPSGYLGVDIVPGPGVDEICNIGDLVRRYGKESFDVVICTEVLEHVRDWRQAVSNLKNVLKPNGILFLSTRSKGFPYHGYPWDFWRYEAEDMNIIFSDLSIRANAPDPTEPGIFVKAVKSGVFRENRLAAHALYSVLTRRRCRDITAFDLLVFDLLHPKLVLRRFLSQALPVGLKAALKKLLPADNG